MHLQARGASLRQCRGGATRCGAAGRRGLAKIRIKDWRESTLRLTSERARTRGAVSGGGTRHWRLHEDGRGWAGRGREQAGRAWRSGAWGHAWGRGAGGARGVGGALTREEEGKRARGVWGGTGHELAGLEVGEAGLDNRAAVRDDEAVARLVNLRASVLVVKASLVLNRVACSGKRSCSGP